MTFLAVLVIPLVALIITPGLLFYFDVTPKLVVLLAIAAALLIAWVFQSPVRMRGFLWFSPVLLLGLGSLALSTILSPNPALSLYGTAWRRFGALPQASILAVTFLIATYTAGKAERATAILRGISAGSLLAALYGIAQYCRWDPLLPISAYHIGEGIWTIVRPPGTLGYSSYFAVWLDMACFASLAGLESDTNVTWRRIAGASAVLSACAMLLSGTRGAYLGLSAGACVWLVWRGFRLRRRLVAGLAVAALLFLVFYLSPFGWQLRSRARWFAEDPWGGARLYLWRDSARMAVDRLAAGYGPEVFSAAFPHYESRQLAAAYPDFAHESPHNIFLDALVAQGLPGLGVLCCICAAGFAAAWRLRAKRGAVAAGIAAALAAGIVSQQFVVFTIPTAMTLYAIVAVAVGLACETAVAPRWRFLRILGLVVAATLLYFGVRFAIADRALAMAQRDINSGDAALAAVHYLQYEHWRLPGTAADLWYSRALLDLAHRTRNPVDAVRATGEAGRAALRATGTAEYPANAWYSLAAFYASQNDAAAAEMSLRGAIAANNHWFKPHWTLAQLLLIESRIDEAQREAALAAVLDGGKFPEVTRTWRESSAKQSARSAQRK
ncbi:MAG TPA: O-antigen ligase family protein [Bryobacteraceae bacterium]